MKARQSLWSALAPFAFLGRGDAHHDVGLELCIWFEGEGKAPSVWKDLPHFEEFTGEGPVVFAHTGEDFPLLLLDPETRKDPDAWPEEETWSAFSTSLEETLGRIHASHPIRFAAISFGDPRRAGLRAAPGEQKAVVETLCKSSLRIEFLDQVYTLARDYLQPRHQNTIRASLLERVASMMARDDSRARDNLVLAADMLEDEGSDPKRRALLQAIAPTLQVALASMSPHLLADIVRGDPRALVKEALSGGVDPEVAADLRALADVLANSLCELEETAPRQRLKDLALALLELAGDVLSSAQRVILLALSGRLDEVLESLESAAEDKTRVDQAVGIAMAEATRLSHRELINACLSTSRKSGAGAQSPMVVANLMHEQLSQSKFEEAANLATFHLQGQGEMSAALYTNALLAFAATSTYSELVLEMVARIEELLESNEGKYFGPDFNSGFDMRGSAYAWLGLWQGMTGDIGGAKKNLEAARDIYPDFLLLPANGSFAVLLARDELRPLFEGQSERALDAKNKAVKKNPRDWWSIFSRGLIHHESGHIEEALVDYRRTIELNPDYPDVYINLGNIRWLEDEDLEAAIELYDKAIELAPNHSIARLNRAEACLVLGRPARALQDAEEVIAHQDGPRARFYAALACEALGDLAGAKVHARQGAEVDPDMSTVDDEEWRDRLRDNL